MEETEQENPYSFEAYLLVDTRNGINTIMDMICACSQAIASSRAGGSPSMILPLTIRGLDQNILDKPLYELAIDRNAWDRANTPIGKMQCFSPTTGSEVLSFEEAKEIYQAGKKHEN